MTEGTLSELLGLFPESATITNGGVLAVGGCALDELAAEHGTPTLVVDEDALRAQARAYRDGLAQRWPRSRVVFASKAFPCTAVQRVMIEEGLGLDVAGGGEIVTALAAGADPETLVQHGNAKTDEEIAMAVEHGVGLVVVDNTDDLDRLEATVPAGRSQPVLVRVIPEVEAETHAAILTGHAGSKFGLSVSDARAAIARIEASPTLDMRGIHAHVGSQILEVEPFAAAVASVARLGAFDVYDLGGGLGVRYTYADHPPTLDHYLDAITDAARAHLPNDSELVLEPGRSMVATSGLTLYRVITVKASGSVFVAVDGGMGDDLECRSPGQRWRSYGRRAGRRRGTRHPGWTALRVWGRPDRRGPAANPQGGRPGGGRRHRRLLLHPVEPLPTGPDGSLSCCSSGTGEATWIPGASPGRTCWRVTYPPVI